MCGIVVELSYGNTAARPVIFHPLLRSTLGRRKNRLETRSETTDIFVTLHESRLLETEQPLLYTILLVKKTLLTTPYTFFIKN